MGKLITVSKSKPLILHSKFLCFSLFFLFSSLFFALYTSLSQSQCLLRSSPFDPIRSPLFSYPSSYGHHKYPLSTSRNTCSSPVFFSDYWDVVREIRDFRDRSSSSSRRLAYMQGNAESFGGNFSAEMRFSYFHHRNDTTHLPCGFLTHFPISHSDKMEMEKCEGLVVVSAIFNDHDKIRQPKGLGSKTLDTVCFFMFIDEITLEGLHYHGLIPQKSTEEEEEHYKVGAWRLVKVSTTKDSYENPAMNGVIPKYLVHRLFPNSKLSIWVDAKVQLMVDPLLLIHSLVISENVDMAISKHPFYVHTMEEAMATARWKKWWDVNALKMQMETYCENGLEPWSNSKFPYPSDVPDSAVILRKHGVRSNLFSCLMFNELEAWNPRDQLAFAFVRDKMRPKLRLNMFEVEVFEQVVVEYRHNLKPALLFNNTNNDNRIRRTRRRRTKRANSDMLYVNTTCCCKCQKYLSLMWGDE
ncbi:transmembrane protein [Senna tora]|uniref:Transmembrane protein n=1 Tax=Senna tora TaxID=362788 RepID=A0A834SIV2_9FABA|nr:transmembrane protein [Senna tora]